MPDKFIVPQFIDVEDKILGPITARQFLICMAAVLLIFIEFKVFSLIYFILIATVTAFIAGVFAFVKINGQPFHIFFINFLQTNMRPALRVWDKEKNATELRYFIQSKEAIKVAPISTKARPESTKLRDLALTVNTGGVYNPEAGE